MLKTSQVMRMIFLDVACSDPQLLQVLHITHRT